MNPVETTKTLGFTVIRKVKEEFVVHYADWYRGEWVLSSASTSAIKHLNHTTNKVAAHLLKGRLTPGQLAPDILITLPLGESHGP